MSEICLVKSLKLHRDRCWSLDVSNGLLATGSASRDIKLVSLHNYELVEELDRTAHKKAVRSVAWRPHSKILAAGSFDSTISIWGMGDNDAINPETDLLAIIEGHENEVKAVAWSSDGYYLATCSRDKSIWIWETDEIGEDYECISVLQEHSQDVKNIVWHPTRHLIASSSYDDTVRIWKEVDEDWECAAVLTGHQGTVWSSSFESVETDLRLCSGSDDGTVRIWRCINDDPSSYEQEWEQEAVLPAAHTKPVYSVCWSSTGLIASSGCDGNLVIYKEVSRGEWIILAQRQLCHTVFEVNVVKWATVGTELLLITGGDDGCVKIWKLDEKNNEVSLNATD
ncbi:HBR262Wp [Eremothecium sinecaudum]|uniref:Probable cytosolic iron-sulfur protein assembly protein 1 n=1 Tax=Eremothecium sinecaudum TaxID=45286 RepID=A0A109UXA0_9SACH|nr:HBR262Wp [Eremothecium sinecaudum]AMD19163.1 HBR262Wp [Eremothecium sinecaudum]